MSTFNLVNRDLRYEIVNLWCEETEDYEPTLKIYKALSPRRCAYIPLPAAWKYDEPDNKQEALMAVNELVNISEFVGLPSDKASLNQFLLWVQDKIDLLVKAPLFIKKERVIGEATINFAGEKMVSEVRG